MPILDNLANTALNLGTVLVVLVALVVAHEFGHFVVARLADVRVHEFGIGLPPRALTYHRGKETAYTLNWLPLGGFVRLEGEDGDSADPRSFSRKSLPVRTVILVAGVIMNFLVAWLIFSLIAGLADPTVGIRVNAFAPTTSSGQVSPAETAGLTPAQVTGNDANGPIYDDSGDVILAIDGQTFNWFDAGTGGAPDGGIRYLRAHAGQTVTLTVRHADGTVSEVPVTLNTADVAAEQGALGIRNYGFIPGSSVQRGPLEALQVGFQRTVQASMLVLNALRDLVSNLTNPQVAGPIGIVNIVGQVRTQAPPIFLVYLIGLLSANLAVINILPIPPMDGGRVMVGFIKSLAGDRLSVDAERATYFIGFALLLAFIAWISYFDIQRLGGGS
ncbi:MAG TPA: M50 family metallopeptidase [Candidatus Dormibacteraeota bacterium]|nr:M50 family metallopeptidase [Candidatus Dormibacteraeota bacterium]